MFKKILIVLTLILFLIGCAPKEEQSSEEVTEQPEEIPATGEGSIDDVATGISDISDIDEELDTSELDDIDSILEEIENI